jgi:hypothetical protein
MTLSEVLSALVVFPQRVLDRTAEGLKLAGMPE